MTKYSSTFKNKTLAACAVIALSLGLNTNAAEKSAPLPVKNKVKSTTKSPLSINVSNLASPTATVVVGVYKSSNKFLDVNDQYKVYYLKPKNGILKAQINDLNYGEYSIALFQDLDGNGVINKNAFGIPKEPYAFSNNFKPVMKAPNFNNCKFTYNTVSNAVNIKLLK